MTEKLPRRTAADTIRALERAGFFFSRQSGSHKIYKKASEYALTKGIIISDTKFEWGVYESKVILIDEVLTPDSSRFWPMESYSPGKSQPSFDKQFVRDYLEKSGWDKQSPPPSLPEDVIQITSQKYLEAYRKLTGEEMP